MYELNTVAIVRYCRAKNAAPKLGFLAPHIKQDYEVHVLPVICNVKTFRLCYGDLDELIGGSLNPSICSHQRWF